MQSITYSDCTFQSITNEPPCQSVSAQLVPCKFKTMPNLEKVQFSSIYRSNYLSLRSLIALTSPFVTLSLPLSRLYLLSTSLFLSLNLAALTPETHPKTDRVLHQAHLTQRVVQEFVCASVCLCVLGLHERRLSLARCISCPLTGGVLRSRVAGKPGICRQCVWARNITLSLSLSFALLFCLYLALFSR